MIGSTILTMEVFYFARALDPGDIMEVCIMAKKKTVVPVPKERRAVVVTLKGSVAWKEWLGALAAEMRTDISKLIDMVLVDFAKAKGFKREAPRR